MKVYLNKITGIDDAIVSMFMSKRTWTREKENDIRGCVYQATDPYSGRWRNMNTETPCCAQKVSKWLDTLCKWGKFHMTMLRFIDLSITVEGLHRAGQDDWDSHAKRFDNRIIRSSTRLAKYNEDEMSDYYKGKILPTDAALAALGITAPHKIELDGKTYVKAVNGYVLEGMENNKDVLRGLYMLSIPSNFIFKIQLTEFAHVYKERRKEGTANPEVKECCEAICDQLEEAYPWFNRELLMAIPN